MRQYLPGQRRPAVRRAAAVGLASTALVGTLTIEGAAASNEQTVVQPDNAAQQVFEDTLTADGNTAADNGEQQLDRSDIVIGPGTNDIHVFDINYAFDPGYYGVTYCYEGGSGPCDHPISEFNIRPADTGSWDAIDWKNLGCHELGHTGSLDHATASNPGCMYGPHSRNISLRDPHDLDIINSNV